MLEDKIKIGSTKATEPYRGVTPVSAYPRINPQQARQEDQPRPEMGKKPARDNRVNRRFTAMRALVELLMGMAQIARVDFNTAYREVCDQGLAIAEEELIDQLLQLKISLNSIDELIQQLRDKKTALTPVSGRPLTVASKLFPGIVPGLSEYVLYFDDLQVKLGPQHSDIITEIDANSRWVMEQNQIRLTFRRFKSIPSASDNPLRLTISILVGVIETNEANRRAILYQRANKSYGLYSDKSIDLSI